MLTGAFNLIFVIISIIVGLKILSKYFEFEKRYYIYIGITWIGISTPWMRGALAFVLLFTNIILAEEMLFYYTKSAINIAAARTRLSFVWEII